MSSEKKRREIRNRKEYLREFPEHIRPEALKHILDIRKFEIDMYWKRAAYFWTFIGAVLAGYILLLNNPNQSSLHRKGQFILITLGVLFSLCWYFVNRGSKFWQLNWEKHLDIMEDELIGPLYKTTIHRDYYKKLFAINEQYPFSVSKINILLSFSVFILWAAIDINFIYANWSQSLRDLCWWHYLRDCYLFLRPWWWNLYTFLFLFQVVSAFSLFLWGKTGKGRNDQFRTHIFFDRREFSEQVASAHFPIKRSS